MRKILIKNAIQTWERRYLGLFFWWEKERYTKQYCIEQLEYFTKMLKDEN